MSKAQLAERDSRIEEFEAQIAEASKKAETALLDRRFVLRTHRSVGRPLVEVVRGKQQVRSLIDGATHITPYGMVDMTFLKLSK